MNTYVVEVLDNHLNSFYVGYVSADSEDDAMAKMGLEWTYDDKAYCCTDDGFIVILYQIEEVASPHDLNQFINRLPQEDHQVNAYGGRVVSQK